MKLTGIVFIFAFITYSHEYSKSINSRKKVDKRGLFHFQNNFFSDNRWECREKFHHVDEVLDRTVEEHRHLMPDPLPFGTIDNKRIREEVNHSFTKSPLFDSITLGPGNLHGTKRFHRGTPSDVICGNNEVLVKTHFRMSLLEAICSVILKILFLPFGGTVKYMFDDIDLGVELSQSARNITKRDLHNVRVKNIVPHIVGGIATLIFGEAWKLGLSQYLLGIIERILVSYFRLIITYQIRDFFDGATESLNFLGYNSHGGKK